MLHIAAAILTSSLIIISPMKNSPFQSQLNSSYETSGGIMQDLVSYDIRVDMPFEELDKIQAAAEKAGLGFNYKLRGIKTRLVIDMVIENESGYELKRYSVNKEEGTIQVQWLENKNGMAISFVQSEPENGFTQH